MPFEIVSADELVTVVDEIAITILTDTQRRLCFPPLGDVMHEYKLSGPSAERQTTCSDLDVDLDPVLFAVSPLARVIVPSSFRREIVFEQFHVFRRTNVLDRHVEKLCTRIAVMAYGGVVH